MMGVVGLCKTSAGTGSSTAAGLRARIAAITATPNRTNATAPCTTPIAANMCDRVPSAIWTTVQTKTMTAHMTPCGIFAKNEVTSMASEASSTTPAKRAWNM
jgi:hypothetical protein